MNKIKFIGLGTTKMCGKDTLCKLLQEINPNIKRVALADSLKSILEPLSWRVFNKSIPNLTPDEKEQIRPVMIEFGRMARNKNIDFWCREMLEQIEIYDSLAEYKNAIYCCCDLRYLNEYHYFKNIYGDSMLFVNIERDGAPEPTDEEKIHSPEVAKMADVTFKWHTDEGFVTLRPLVRDFYNKYLA